MGSWRIFEFVAKWVNADFVANLCTQAEEEEAEVCHRKQSVDAKLQLICMQNFRIVEGRSHKTALTIRPGPEVATLAARPEKAGPELSMICSIIGKTCK